MFRLPRSVPYFAAGALTVIALLLSSPKALRAIAATLVQVVNTTANPVPTAPAVPGDPYFGTITLHSIGGEQSVGPGTGTLGVTQILITNLDSVVNQVQIGSAVLSGGTCGTNANIETISAPLLNVKVQPNSTLVMPMPTPVVFPPVLGADSMNHTCVVAAMPVTNGNAIIMINGFVN